MGMFDSFYFAKGVLPDNKEPPECEFQTKSLACNLDNYYVDENKIVTMKEFDFEGDYKDGNPTIDEAAYVYSYNFDHKPTRYQEYKIVILDDKLVKAIKIKDEGYD